MKYELDQPVKITSTGVTGTVISRAEHARPRPDYIVRTADGEQWHNEDLLEEVPVA